MHLGPSLSSCQARRLCNQGAIGGDQPVCQVCIGDAGLLQLTLHATVVEPFDAKYQEIKEFGTDVKVKLHPLLATALFG